MSDIKGVLLIEQCVANIQVHDGCQLLLVGADGKAAGWALHLPQGTVVKCPHGRLWVSPQGITLEVIGGSGL